MGFIQTESMGACVLAAGTPIKGSPYEMLWTQWAHSVVSNDVSAAPHNPQRSDEALPSSAPKGPWGLLKGFSFWKTGGPSDPSRVPCIEAGVNRAS
jgi:hypothetical protein